MSILWSDKGQRKYLSPPEIREFVHASELHSTRIHLFCAFLAQSGCRISEALSVAPRNFDFGQSTVTIESLKKRRSGVYREIPIPTELAESIQQFVTDEHLPISQKIWPFSRMTAYRYVRLIMKQIHLIGPCASPKGLRHGFAIEAIQSGVPLNIVQRWLGHASMTTTAIYASATGPEERRLADLMWQRENYTKKPGAEQGKRRHLNRLSFITTGG